jgi:hypothetical protein
MTRNADRPGSCELPGPSITSTFPAASADHGSSPGLEVATDAAPDAPLWFHRYAYGVAGELLATDPRYAGLSATDAAVFTAAASFIGLSRWHRSDPRLTASQEELATRVRVTSRQVRRALARLCEAGALEHTGEYTHRADGRRGTAIYRQTAMREEFARIDGRSAPGAGQQVGSPDTMSGQQVGSTDTMSGLESSPDTMSDKSPDTMSDKSPDTMSDNSSQSSDLEGSLTDGRAAAPAAPADAAAVLALDETAGDPLIGEVMSRLGVSLEDALEWRSATLKRCRSDDPVTRRAYLEDGLRRDAARLAKRREPAPAKTSSEPRPPADKPARRQVDEVDDADDLDTGLDMTPHGRESRARDLVLSRGLTHAEAAKRVEHPVDRVRAALLHDAVADVERGRRTLAAAAHRYGFKIDELYAARLEFAADRLVTDRAVRQWQAVAGVFDDCDVALYVGAKPLEIAAQRLEVPVEELAAEAERLLRAAAGEPAPLTPRRLVVVA